MQNDQQSRRDAIFELIVREYIDTAEPVGSRTISRCYKAGLSPASIRNVMADLEDQGLLKQPHTSAGRIPTDKGYRYYVDSLMEPEELAEDERELIAGELSRARTIEGLAEKVSKVIPRLTGNAAIIYIKNLKKISFLNHLLEELIEEQTISDFFEEETGVFIEGVLRVLEQPEFQDLEKVKPLLRAFEEKYGLLQMLADDLEGRDVQVHIGSENEAEPLENVSLVVKDCYISGALFGGVAVIGPTRMKYAKVMSIVDFVADTITDTIRRF